MFAKGHHFRGPGECCAFLAVKSFSAHETVLVTVISSGYRWQNIQFLHFI